MSTLQKKIARTAGASAACGLALLLSPVLTGNSGAEASIFSTEKFDMYADFRLRFESDFDSQKSSGAERDDRSRLRIRARVGANYKPVDYIKIGARLRTGSDDSHQSPHITVEDFDDNPHGDDDINFDKWFVQYNQNGLTAWAGRNSINFWKQNELIWDDDVTPAGIAFSYKTSLAGTNLSLNAGRFYLPVGMQDWSGDLTTFQVVASGKTADVGWTAALGVLAFEDDKNDEDALRLLSENGMRDYTLIVASLQAKMTVQDRPLVVGFDYTHNAKDYSSTSSNATTAANHNERDGYDVSVKYGSMKKRFDWQVGYAYAHMEKFAVNSSYSQDDWMRWGSAVETRSSDYKGHEVRIGLGLGNNMNILARFYTAESLSTIEDGKRFRLDYNVKF